MCTCIWSMFLSWSSQILCRDIFVSAIIGSECMWMLPFCMVTMAPLCLGAVQDHAHWHQPFARKPKTFLQTTGDIRFWVTWSTITSKIGVEFPLNFPGFKHTQLPGCDPGKAIMINYVKWGCSHVFKQVQTKSKGPWLCSACIPLQSQGMHFDMQRP